MGPWCNTQKLNTLIQMESGMEDVFVEITGDIVFESHPDDIREEGRSPDSLSQTACSKQSS